MSEKQKDLKNEQLSSEQKFKEQVEKSKKLLSDSKFINDILNTATIEEVKALFNNKGIDTTEEELYVLRRLSSMIHTLKEKEKNDGIT